MILKCDGVFEGGGVKGIGFAGAISAVEKAGYRFQNVVGTSAGAIAASLVAAGYTGDEICEALQTLDYDKFREKRGIDRCGLLGKAVSLVAHFGVYKSDYFEEWLTGLLEKKHKYVFGDLRTGYSDRRYRYKFQAVASDITDKRMLVLPGGLARFGIDPDGYSIAKAVRMSISIPFFYEPFRLKDGEGKEHLIVDGGLLSNYPVWLLDDGTSDPPWPTFGFKFMGKTGEDGEVMPIKNIGDYSMAVLSTLLDAHDNYYIIRSRGDSGRSILIPIEVETSKGKKAISTTYFEISKEQSAALAENGRSAAAEFLQTWDFDGWKRRYREYS